MNSVRRVSELPQPFRDAFSAFKLFNAVQSDCFQECFQTDVNMVIAAPTGSGKTVTLELCMLRLLSRHLDPDGQWCLAKGQYKVVYVAPTKALIQERVKDWINRFGNLNISIVECTGDSAEALDLTQADVIATTPEKLDALSRRCFDTGSMRFVSDVALLLIDEVHVVSETRGPTLEAGVVCRLQALGSMPQMHGTNLSNLRIVAASATIPNVYDVARWIRAPDEGCKVFGEEMRPVTIRTVVKAFPPGKNDFLFERHLNEKVFPILQEHWQQKPVMIFCSSRKGTVECCNKIIDASKHVRVQSPSFFVRNSAQQARLRQAASALQDKALVDFIVQGLAWHHAAMSHQDRALVEQLYISRDLMCIAATATLAQGVNLPAYLVIIKGTQRYCSDGGKGPSSYQEYDQGECLQMIGRAGRPQFESSATAVIMTKSEHRTRYQNLANGRKPVESNLHRCSTEFLNADIAQRIVTSVNQAHAWLQKSLFWVRVFKNPAQYGFTALGITPDSIAQQAMHLFIDVPLQKLQDSGLIEINSADGSITPKDPSLLMCKHCVQLATMVMINAVPDAASPRDLLEIVCKASENSDVMLRRTEKKALNELNHAASVREGNAPGSSYMVRDGTDSGKRKQRLSEAWEKSFVLVNSCLAAGGVHGPSIDYSMISDSAKVIQNGLRIVTCMIRYYEFQRRFAAMTAAIRLHRALLQKMWDAYECTCRQVPGVGNVLVQRLLAAGIRSMKDFIAADPRQLELVTTKLYPWGDTKREDAKKLLPPPCSLDVQILGGDRLPKVKVTVQCTEPGRSKSFCWLVVGCLNDDSLLLSRYFDVAAIQQPMENTTTLRNKVTGDVRIVAAILSDRVIGGDIVTPITHTIKSLADLRQERPSKPPVYVTGGDARPPMHVPGVTPQDFQALRNNVPLIGSTTQGSMCATTEQKQTAVPAAANARAVSGSGNLVTSEPAAPVPRHRASEWVTRLARELNSDTFRPQPQPSGAVQPMQYEQEKSATPVHHQTLAERVAHVKHGTAAHPLPPAHLHNSHHHNVQGKSTAELAASMQCNAAQMDVAVRAAVTPACDSSPNSDVWQMTSLHAPPPTGVSNAVKSSDPNSIGRTQASAPADASRQTVGVHSMAAAAGEHGALTEHLHPAANTENGPCSNEDICIVDSSANFQDAHPSRTGTVRQDKAVAPPDSIPSTMPQAETPATATAHLQTAPRSEPQPSAAVYACSSHVQPSPDSPTLKPGGPDNTCRQSPAPTHEILKTPSLHGTAASQALQAVQHADASVSAPAPPVSRRKALKHLIQRARQILASEPSNDANCSASTAIQQGKDMQVVSKAVVGASSGQEILARSSCKPHLPTSQPKFRDAPAPELPNMLHTEHVQPGPTFLESKRSLVSAFGFNDSSRADICKAAPATQEIRMLESYTTSGSFLASETQLAVQPESSADVENNAACLKRAQSVKSLCKDNGVLPSKPCTMHSGIWDQFTSRRKTQSTSAAPRTAGASTQHWTESAEPESMHTPLQDTPSPLLAEPETARSGASCVDAPSTATKTQSLIQNLLIGKSKGGDERLKNELTLNQKVGKSVSKAQSAKPQMPAFAGVREARSMQVTVPAASTPQRVGSEYNAGYLDAFSEQDIVLSPDFPLKSATRGRMQLVPTDNTVTPGAAIAGMPNVRSRHADVLQVGEIGSYNGSASHALADPAAAPPNKLLAGQIDNGHTPEVQEVHDSCLKTPSEHADAVKVVFSSLQADCSQEQTAGGEAMLPSTATRSSLSMQPAHDAIRAFTDKCRAPVVSEREHATQYRPCPKSDKDNQENVDTVGTEVGHARRQQRPVEQESNGKSSFSTADTSCCTAQCLPDAHHEHQQAVTGTCQPCPPGHVLAASRECEQVQGGKYRGIPSQLQATKLKVIRLPQLPHTRKASGSLSKVGSTCNDGGSGKTTEKTVHSFKEGNMLSLKRRLGGGAGVAHMRAETAPDNKGLKRAFKVPRSK